MGSSVVPLRIRLGSGGAAPLCPMRSGQDLPEVIKNPGKCLGIGINIAPVEKWIIFSRLGWFWREGTTAKDRASRGQTREAATSPEHHEQLLRDFFPPAF